MTGAKSQFYFTQDEVTGHWICVEEYNNSLQPPTTLAIGPNFNACLAKAQLYLKLRYTRIPWDGVSDIEPPAS